jgi:GT2 family glycosyltransferase
MLLSVVMPARNCAIHLPTQLRALAAQDYGGDWELIVADNGSTDGTVAVVTAASATLPDVRIVDASRRTGANTARNEGARRARGEFILFIDADDEVDTGWMRAMAAAAHEAHAVGGAIDRTRFRPPASPDPVEARTTALQPWPGFYPFPMGANCGIRAAHFRDLGGFDESYSRGGDETELFWRLQLAGHPIEFVADAVVYYRERHTTGDLWRQYFHYGTQDPHLYRDFRRSGMPGRGVAAGVSSWGHLAVHAPRYLRTGEGRRQWVRSSARRVGRIVGSARYRSIYL